jgi:hypothetical protein
MIKQRYHFWPGSITIGVVAVVALVCVLRLAGVL